MSSSEGFQNYIGKAAANDDLASTKSTEGRLIYPEPYQIGPEEVEADHVWGFKDTAFSVNSKGHVELTGKRYSLCGEELPSLLPWVRDVMGVDFDVTQTNEHRYPPQIPNPVSNQAFRSKIHEFLSDDQISVDPETRLRHGHGHTQYEMYAIKYGQLKRVPDLVLYPTEEEHVEKIVKAAMASDVCLIPYGGGTCVTEALLCPANETRMIVSIDMKRMNRILWIDPENRMACIQAGAVGRHIVLELEKYGFTMGHEPDSIEFSTLGGWIATNASGMKKNKYGNIEDIVLDMNVVTAHGNLERSSVAPREATGVDPRQWMFGSEGNFGVITKAVVKLFPIPESKKYGSVIFPTFEDGYQFMYDIMREGKPPASIRLVDNLQFQFSMALKPKKTGFAAFKSKIEKWVVTKLKGFDPKKMVACTLVFEGTEREVTQQESFIYDLAKRHKGMKAGSENGERGYQLTYGIAYIRDFVMDYYVIAESFETSMPWNKVLSLCENVKRRVWLEHQNRNLPGTPFVTCRITQLYDTGACVYFYFAYYYKGVENPSQVYAELEEAARDEILKSGGSLSHHHGVGKLRQKYLKDIKSPAMLQLNQKVKEVVDPQNVFGSNNQGLVSTQKKSSAHTGT